MESNITSLRSSILGDLQRLRSSTKEEKLRTSLAFLADHGVDAPFELTADFLLHNRSIEISDAGQQALAITVDRCSAAALALYLVTHYPQLDFVEPKLGIGARGHYSSRHMSTGTSEESRTSTFLPWAPYGLNGSGVVISVADTGVDFMHSMFLQVSFCTACSCRCPFASCTACSCRCPFAQGLAALALASNDLFEAQIMHNCMHVA